MIPIDKKHKRIFLIILVLAVFFKLSIFIFGVMRVPDSIFDGDSDTYIQTGKNLYENGVFAIKDNKGAFKYEFLRTPGYPFFLAIFHDAMNIHLLGVIFIQLLLTVLAGLITYKIAMEIDFRIGILSMAISLFDPPTSVHSLKIMTEAVYLPILALFIYLFIKYLKNSKLNLLILSSIVLAMSTYVRPVSYFLGVAVPIFILYAKCGRSFKKTLAHAAVFLIIFYSLLSFWHLRNYSRFGDPSFAAIGASNFKNYGVANVVQTDKDYITQGLQFTGSSFRSFVSLMTLPGSLKYYKSKLWGVLGKIIFYPWMAFWLIGFLVGCFNLRRNIYYQFLFWLIIYFATVTVLNLGSAAGERLRIPMVMSIAIISAYGWDLILRIKCQYFQ